MKLFDKALSHYKTKGYKVSGYIFDITDDKLAATKISEMVSDGGQIDILVNNAGIIKRELATTMPVDDFRRVIEVDLVGAFIISQLLGNRMIKNGGGKIINICSMMSELGRNSVSEDLAGTAIFLASKASDFVNGQIVYVDGGILATIGKPSNEI